MVEKMFNQAKLLRMLPQLEGKLYYAEKTDSTNDWAKQLVLDGVESGALVVAESQTRGRGRGGKSWTCPLGEGLLFSLVLEPDLPKEQWPQLALATGLAVSDVLGEYGVTASIKWPNDVWVGDKKCAGILIESCEDTLVIGVGLNVSVRHFPEGVDATSMLLEGAAEVEREEMLVALVQKIIQWGSRCGEGFEDVVRAVNQRCVFVGEEIELQCHGRTQRGIMRGVDGEGYLLLEQSGKITAIAQADRVRRAKLCDL